MSIPFLYSQQNKIHTIELSPTVKPSDTAVTISGTRYKILGREADVTSLKQQLAKLPKEFKSVHEFEATLHKEGVECKLKAVAQKNLKTVLKKGEISKTGTGALQKTLNEAVANRAELQKLRNKAASQINKKPANEIAHEISVGMKNFLSRLYQEGLDKLGPPPCRFCVVGLGSIGRNESGPFPDYDNLLIIEKDLAPDKAAIKECEREIAGLETKISQGDKSAIGKSKDLKEKLTILKGSFEYFSKLNQYVADRVYRLGESESGLRFCEGNLNSPYQRYELRYADDPKHKETYGGRADLLDEPIQPKAEVLSIVDSAPIIGNSNLYDRYLGQALSKANIKKETISNIKRQIKGIEDKNNPSPIREKDLPDIVHVKEQLLRFPQATVTSLALYYGIKEKNSLARIKALTELGVFTPAFAERLSHTIEDLIKLRVQSQSAHQEEFEFVCTGDWNNLIQGEKNLADRLHAILKEEKEMGTTYKEAFEKSKKELESLESKNVDAAAKARIKEIKGKLSFLGNKMGTKEFLEDSLKKFLPKIIENQFPLKFAEREALTSIRDLTKNGFFDQASAKNLRESIEGLTNLRMQIAEGKQPKKAELALSESLKKSLNENLQILQREEQEMGTSFKKAINEMKKNIITLQNKADHKKVDQAQKALKTLESKLKAKEFFERSLHTFYSKEEAGIVAFTKEDRQNVEDNIIPTLRDLYGMAKKSVDGNTFHPEAFHE